MRAEEYNQINEGGLRPLLQAAAATAKFGGDINKLRAAVLAGKVSSAEFFNAIMAGAAQLEGQASKATLTLSGAFEALSSRLTVYLGQSAEASGTTAALAGAMQLLADNLDVVVPALATIAAVMGGAVVVNAIAGSRAFFALTAAIGGASTAAEAATFAFGGLGAVLTGPAGIAAAVLAVGAGLYYLASQSSRAEDAVKSLEESNKDARTELDRMIGRLKAAGVQTDELAAAADNAKASVDGLADAYRRALIEARKFNEGTAAGRLQHENDTVRDSQRNQESIRRQLDAAYESRAGSVSRFGYLPGQDSKIRSLEAQLNAEEERERIARAAILTIAKAAQSGLALEDDKRPPAPSTSQKPERKKGRTRSAADPLDQDFRNAQDLRQLQLEELRAKEQGATAATKKADFAREALVLEAEMRRADIAEAVRKKQLTKNEADARLKIIDNLYGAADEITVQGREAAYQREITRREQEQLARQQTDAMRDELDALGAESGVTDVRKARVEIERRMLDLQQEIERKLLDEAIARGDVADAAAARARLARKQEADRTGLERDNMGPLGQYLEEIRKVGLNMDDEFEKIAVNGLKTLNDGLTDAIMNSENLGDVFKNVAKQIIADLIRIAIQQQIVNALARAFNMGGGGGRGLGGLLGAEAFSLLGAPGRASGGRVNAGQIYRVNEGAGAGRAEYFKPAVSGDIIPLGAVNQRAAQGGGQTIIQQTVNVDTRGSVNPQGFAEHIRASVRQETIGIVAQASNATLKAMPGKLASYQRDGTL